MTILLRKDSFAKEVQNLIYQKQLDFTKEKGRKISLEKTVERLIKDAYLKDSKPKTLTP